MRPFSLILKSAPSSQATSPAIAQAHGVSIGRSGDAGSTAVILGGSGLENAATDIANRFSAAGRQPPAGVPDGGGTGVVLIDHVQRKAFAVAPPIGLQQLYWAASADDVRFASDPQRLGFMPERSPTIPPEAVFQYVYFHMIPGPLTAWVGISKLEGGHSLCWESGATSVTRYWRPTFAERMTGTSADATAELHRLLRLAVERSLGDSAAAGAFLSGGLDSSTVAGFASQLRPGIRTVTMGFDAAGYDEIEYARIASRHFGTRPIEYYVTPDDVLTALPTIAAAFAEPFGNSSAAAVYQCARVAREHGLDLLLAGDGGDELFGGNERYAEQLVFERYQSMPSLLRRGLLEPAVDAAARFTRRFPIGKAQSYIRNAYTPLPDRLQRYNFLHRQNPAAIFTPALLAQVDASAPMQLLREEYGAPVTQSPVNRMMFLDWKFTLRDNDLVKVNAMAQLAGLRVSYPMLDDAVLDFSLRIPGDWKVRRGQLRWFYKRAMRNFLPKAIIDKTKHGFGLPFGVWTRTHAGLSKLAGDSLATLGERGFFRQDFLAQALRLHREGHASYYGELVWILVVFELWLRARMPNARI